MKDGLPKELADKNSAPNFSAIQSIKDSFLKFFRAQKFLLEKFQYNKPSSPITDRETWKNVHQNYEINESCLHDHNHSEETKQKYYSMLLDIPFFYDCQGKSILDIGGGPDSMLLRARNFSKARIVDPGEYPKSVVDNYKKNNIEYVRQLAEDYTSAEQFDEVWIYNVLQHTVNTKQIIENSLRSAKERIRFLDWAYTKPTLGHPQTVTMKYLFDNFRKNGWEWKTLKENYLDDREFELVGWLIWGIFEKK